MLQNCHCKSISRQSKLLNQGSSQVTELHLQVIGIPRQDIRLPLEVIKFLLEVTEIRRQMFKLPLQRTIFPVSC